jgi:hypothetical protein
VTSTMPRRVRPGGGQRAGHRPRRRSVAAAHADEVPVLADGRIVSWLPAPTTERVLKRMKCLELAGSKGRMDVLSAHQRRVRLSATYRAARAPGVRQAPAPGGGAR